MKDEPLLTIKDVVERLPGVSERELRSEIRRLGCASKIGRQLFMTERQFEYLLEQTTIPAWEDLSGSPDTSVSKFMNRVEQMRTMENRKMQRRLKRLRDKAQ